MIAGAQMEDRRRDQKGAGPREGEEVAAALSALNQTLREAEENCAGMEPRGREEAFDAPDETRSGRAAAVVPSVRLSVASHESRGELLS